MFVTLTIETAQGRKRVPLPGDRVSIGRGQSAMISIDVEGLSRLHATIHRDGNRVWIVDENSTNGTFVNDAPVKPSGTPLADGDEIRLGLDTLIFIECAAGEHASRYDAAQDFADDESYTQSRGAHDYERESVGRYDQDGDYNERGGAAHEGSHEASMASRRSMLLSPVVIAPLIILVLLISVGALGSYLLGKRKADAPTGRRTPRDADATNNVGESSRGSNRPPAERNANGESTSVASAQNQTDASGEASDDSLGFTPARTVRPNGNIKQYKAMTPEEQMAFIKERAEHIALMMGNRPYKFTPEALNIIKNYLDGYASRASGKCSGIPVGQDCANLSQSALSRQCLWGEGLPTMYARARCFAPTIIKAFNERGVPPVVGLYLPAIETEYHTCLYSPVGAGGLYQIMPATARGYGMDPQYLCDASKSTPAAAAYMRDRILEFGTHPMSVALGISGYNRNPESVKRDLRNVLNSGDNENKERSFWTLLTNSDQLDTPFRNENIKYVPKFFAAAIVGETPWAFGLDDFQPISTYTK